MTLVIASLTQPLVDFAISVINDLGAFGIFLLMLLESACIPIPSEATMLFAGAATVGKDPNFTFIAAVTAGVLGNVVGSWVGYGIGHLGRVDLIEKHGKKIGVRTHHLEIADRWFADHGEATPSGGSRSTPHLAASHGCCSSPGQGSRPGTIGTIGSTSLNMWTISWPRESLLESSGL
ncbi:MAG: hypothetical protein NTX07_02240 [Solirubrobacterales bacterium]|nr:hypothetical protein [Solirubrobacterales bacterium]